MTNRVVGTLVITPSSGQAEFIPEVAEIPCPDRDCVRWEVLADPYRLIAFIKKFRVSIESASITARVYAIDVDRNDLYLWLGTKESQST